MGRDDPILNFEFDVWFLFTQKQWSDALLFETEEANFYEDEKNTGKKITI